MLLGDDFNRRLGQIINMIFKYHDGREWITFCILSYAVLATAGIFGVVLVYSGSGADMLGFASMLLRDSRYMNVI